MREGSEEYLDSEKYELKGRRLDGPLLPLVRRLNEIRRATPALQHFDNLRILDTHNEHLFAVAKGREPRRGRRTSIRSRPRGLAIVPPVARLAGGVRGRRAAVAAALPLADGANYVGLGPGRRTS